MDSLDPFAQKKKQQINSQTPSLNQLSQAPLNQFNQQQFSSNNNFNNNNTTNTTTTLSAHDLDIFIKPSPQYNSNSVTSSSSFNSTFSNNQTSFDPFFDSKSTFSNHSFDPFHTPISSTETKQTNIHSFDPFSPSIPTNLRPPQLQLSQQQSPPQQKQQQQTTFASFDPFAPSFPASQSFQSQSNNNNTAPPPSSSFQFDSDFGFFNQSQFEPKKSPNDVEVIELDWSISPPKLESSKSNPDVEDALQKLRSAYGLSDTAELDDNLDNSDHGNDDHNNKEVEWPGSPRLPIPRPPVSAPVIGKPVSGRYSHTGATHSPYPMTDDRNVVSVDDLNLPTEGLILARLSVRSLVTKDWQTVFWVLSTNHHRRPLHIDEDPLSLLIYRSRDDYEGHPLGTMIKKEIPIRMNLSCIPIRRKEYKGYGMLHYFMLEENTEMGTVPVIKFASVNRNDVDVLWINLKARINASKKKAVKSLVDSRHR